MKKKLVLGLFTLFTFTLFACDSLLGDEGTDTPPTETQPEGWDPLEGQELDIFNMGELYEFVSEGEVIFYTTLFTDDQDELNNTRIVTIPPTGVGIEHFAMSFDTMEELEEALEIYSFTTLLVEVDPYYFFATQVDDNEIILTNDSRDEFSEVDPSLVFELVIYQEQDGVKFHTKGLPDDAGEVREVEQEVLFDAVVETRRGIENIQVNEEFNYSGGILVLRDEFEFFTTDGYTEEVEGISVPIDITNVLDTAYTVNHFVPLVNISSESGEALDSISALAYPGENQHYTDMGEEIIEPGETVRTYLIFETDPSGQYEVEITNFIYSRTIHFEAVN